MSIATCCWKCGRTYCYTHGEDPALVLARGISEGLIPVTENQLTEFGIKRCAIDYKAQQHYELALLAQEFFAHLEFRDDYEYGAPGLDQKRPFGNSDVEGDVLKILDAKMLGDDGDGPCWSSQQREHARDLYRNKLAAWLKMYRC